MHCTLIFRVKYCRMNTNRRRIPVYSINYSCFLLPFRIILRHNFSKINISASIYPPPLLNKSHHCNPHKITFRTGGQVPSEHYTNRNNHIFTHRLAKDSKFHIHKILNNFGTFRRLLNSYMCKILFVLKRFRVQNFVWIQRVEIFILNFSKCRVLLALAYIAQ